MAIIYIEIKNMQVINANLSSSYLSADLSQNAYLGFSHNLARYLDRLIPIKPNFFGNLGQDSKVTLGHEKAFAILKNVEFNQGHASFVGHLNESNHKSLNIPMNPPEIKGTIKQTLVMKLNIRDDADHENLIQWTRDFLYFNRFSGGDIINPDHLQINISKESQTAELIQSLQSEKGWYVQDATARLVDKAQQSDFTVAFCDFLSTFKLIEKSKEGKPDITRHKKNHKGWFYASLSGYQLLEAPKQRQGSRFNYPHAFSEPIIGLHELVYFRSSDIKMDVIENLFWYSQFENNCYYLTQGN